MAIESKYIELPSEEINYFTTKNPSFSLYFCGECKVVFVEDIISSRRSAQNGHSGTSMTAPNTNGRMPRCSRRTEYEPPFLP